MKKRYTLALEDSFTPLGSWWVARECGSGMHIKAAFGKWIVEAECRRLGLTRCKKTVDTSTNPQ